MLRFLSLYLMSAYVTSAFVPPSFARPRKAAVVVQMAANGPPKYTKRPATVVSNEKVGSGSYLIRIQKQDKEPLDYQPGHVLAFETKGTDGAWVPGPYTVTRCNGDSLDILYKVVGPKTEAFQNMPLGTAVQFGGKFKVPVLEGIRQDGLERVVGIATGVGMGPLLGFAEQALKQDFPANIELFLAFRTKDDVCCQSDLDELVQTYGENRFSWTPIVSSQEGRLTTRENLERLVQNNMQRTPGSTHYHMVGNGSMVNEMVAGLKEAGVPDERVTLEMYFNHKVEPRPEVVSTIAEVLNEVAFAK